MLLTYMLPLSYSLWDFAKLMFFSILIYSIAQYFIFGRHFPNFFFAKAATLFIAPILFILGSYLIDLLLGTAYITTHVLVFAISVGAGQYLSYLFMRHELHFRLMNAYAVLGTFVMLAVIFAFLQDTRTFNAPIFRPMETYQRNIQFRR
jgi:hypothetical protein